MKIISRFANWIRPQATGRPAPSDDVWFGPVAQPTASGAMITPAVALTVTAVMECVRVLGETLASVPLNVFKQLPNGGQEPDRDHPLWPLLHDQPNEWQTSVEWRELMMGWLTMLGNAYSEIIFNRLGVIEALKPIHPDRVKCERLATGKLVYIVQVGESMFNERRISQDRMLHVRNFSTGGLKGLSPIAMLAERIGHLKGADDYGARVFANDARPGGVLQHPQTLSDKARQNLETSWAQAHAGSDNAHKVAVLEDGMEWKKVGIDPDEAQFLQTLIFEKGDVAAFYRVPHHKVGLLERATFDNITQQDISFVKDTMVPYFRRFEDAFKRDLITDTATTSVKFIEDGLLRGDPKTRSEALQIQKQNGALTANEWRAMENRNPIEGGDVAVVSANIGGNPDAPTDNNDTEAAVTVAPIESMEHVIEDCAKRISAAEIREISKRIDKAEDDRDKFNTWIESFFNGKHRHYTALVLAPLVAHWQRETGCLMDAGALEKEIIDDSVTIWQTDIVSEVWAEWQAIRPAEVRQIITQGMQDAVSKLN